jgi:hypothetical protein
MQSGSDPSQDSMRSGPVGTEFLGALVPLGVSGVFGVAEELADDGIVGHKCRVAIR